MLVSLLFSLLNALTVPASMPVGLFVVLPFVVALVATWWIHPYIVRMAVERHLTDDPGRRKLQTRPVPVLGGMAVFFGIVIGAGALSMAFDSRALFVYIIALTVMMYTGLLDDMIGLTPWMRIVLQLGVVAFVASIDCTAINDLHGVLGIGRLPFVVALLLTAVACCGITNSINLIDGVNGLSSGYCMLASLCFAAVFVQCGDRPMACMALLSAGALMPFWVHNVFGRNSRMFIGDSGTLMMGMMMSIYCMHMLASDSPVAAARPDMGVVALSLSILSVPVFDTLRVMTGRIAQGISPFHADKSHLHHLFLELGTSHIGAALAVITLNGLNVLLWWVSYRLGADATVQLVVVAVVGLVTTFGFYYIVRRLPDTSRARRLLQCYARHTVRWEQSEGWGRLQRFVDRH